MGGRFKWRNQDPEFASRFESQVGHQEGGAKEQKKRDAEYVRSRGPPPGLSDWFLPSLDVNNPKFRKFVGGDAKAETMEGELERVYA